MAMTLSRGKAGCKLTVNSQVSQSSAVSQMILTSNKHGVTPPLKWGNRNCSQEMFSTCQLIGVCAEDHLFLDLSLFYEQHIDDKMINSKLDELFASIFQLGLFYVTCVVYVSHRSSGGSLLLNHSDETFTATPDAYLALPHPHNWDIWDWGKRPGLFLGHEGWAMGWEDKQDRF